MPKTEIALPQIRHARIEPNEKKYEVDVDAARLANFLCSVGMSAEQISALKVTICHEGIVNRPFMGAEAFGQYDYRDKEIALYADSLWRKHEGTLKWAESIMKSSADKTKPVGHNFGGYLYTRRLPRYLANTNIPEERRRNFAQKIFTQALQRSVNDVLVHEIQHGLDDGNKLLRNTTIALYNGALVVCGIAGSVLGYELGEGINIPIVRELSKFLGLAVGMWGGIYISPRIAWILNPSETRAMKLASIHKNSLNTHSIITFTLLVDKPAELPTVVS